jgi:hypothetical protein
MGWFRFVVPFILLCIGAVLLAKGYEHWSSSKQIIDESIATDGTVIRNAPYLSTSKVGKNSSLVYFPQVRYTTKDGVEVEFTSQVTSRAEQYKPGDQVHILYKEQAPDNAIIGSFKALWSIAIIFTVSGILVVLFAIWFYMKAQRGWSDEDAD